MISVETHILHFCVLILILLEVTQIDLCSVKGFAGMTVLILILLEVTQITEVAGKGEITYDMS